MNRTAIKNFAVWARKSLRDEVATNAARFGVTRTGLSEPTYVAGGMVIGAATFDAPTTNIYRALSDDLKARGGDKPLEHAVDELIDEMAYTWFNRLAALRYMEVKGYLGRVLSSSTPGSTEPDLLRDALTLGDRGLALGGIAAVGQLQLLQPLFGLALAATLLHEAVDPVLHVVCGVRGKRGGRSVRHERMHMRGARRASRRRECAGGQGRAGRQELAEGAGVREERVDRLDRQHVRGQ